MPEAIDLLDAFAAGFYLLFGIVHLDLWRRRRDVLPHLWLAAASGGALVVDVTGIAIRHFGDVLPLPFVSLNVLGVAAASVALHRMTCALSGHRPGTVARVLELAALAAAPFVPAAAPLLPLVAILCALLLALAIREAFRYRGQGREGAAFVAGGFLVLAVCLIGDLIMEVGLVPKVSGLPALGFVTLFLASARALADRLEAEQRELTELRRELEQRVEERTLELQEANRRLAETSRTDQLTALPNRRGFLDAAAQELRHAQRTGQPLGLLLADVDHFKAINDTFGHAAGDEVLYRVAVLLREAIRAQDLVARWGGEEFILLLPDTDLAGALRVAEHARVKVAMHPFDVDGRSLEVTLSLGVAPHRPGAPLDETLAEADRALYRAKQAGRNRIEAAAPPEPLPDRPAPADA